MLNRNNSEYIRILELLSIISEEVGELHQSANNYLFKGNLLELENAVKEAGQIISPVLELQALLEIIVKLRKNE